MTTLTPIEEVIQRAKNAATFLGNPGAWNPNAAPTIAEYKEHLDHAISELMAASGRVRYLEQDASLRERSHALSIAARDSDHEEASREITRLRKLVDDQRSRIGQLMATLREQVPTDDEIGELLLDCREGIEWMESVRGGAVQVGDLAKVAALFTKLEGYTRQQEVKRRENTVGPNPDVIDLLPFQGELQELRDNTPGNAEVVDALTRTLSMALKVIDREQRARLATIRSGTLHREVGR